MSRLTYHLRPRLSHIDIPNPSKALLKIFLFKKKPPIEIGFGLVMMIVIAIIFFTRIVALSATTALPVAEAVTTPIMVPVLNATVSPDANEFDPYNTDAEFYKTEVAYTQALKEDAERNFYTDLVKGDSRIVDAVYTYARKLNKDLAFALLLQESSGKPHAENKNIDPTTGEIVSIDRGLFQLNSKSYPDLTPAEAFNIEINVKYGIGHIRGALESANGNVRKALWVYNAGDGATTIEKTPKKTLAYAGKIIASTKAIKLQREQYIKDALSKYLVAYKE